MTTSPEINEIIKSMAAVQGNIEGAKKDKKNPFFKSSYADLSSCWAACREELSKNGIAVIQTTETMDGTLNLVTLLAHQSGQYIKSYLPITPEKNDAQSLGKTITYLRRFSLCSIVGISTADDDGESLMNRNGNTSKAKPKETLEAITPEQWDNLEFWIDENDELRKNLLNLMKRKWGIDTLQEMPLHLYKSALARAKSEAEESTEEKAV